MKITRRKFLEAAPVAAAAMLTLKGTALGQKGVLAARDKLAQLKWESFLQFVNTDFIFRGPGGVEVPLTLVDMKDSRPYPSRARTLGQENFVMKFRGPGKLPLTQGTYTVSHFNLGEFNLFITEGGKAGRNNHYFAVVNRALV